MIYSVSYFNVVGLGASFGGANWPSRLLSRLNHAPLLWTYCICSCFLVVLLPLHAITRFFSHPSYFFATVSISATAASTLLTSFLTLSTTSCCFPVPPFVSNCISVFFSFFFVAHGLRFVACDAFSYVHDPHCLFRAKLFLLETLVCSAPHSAVVLHAPASLILVVCHESTTDRILILGSSQEPGLATHLLTAGEWLLSCTRSIFLFHSPVPYKLFQCTLSPRFQFGKISKRSSHPSQAQLSSLRNFLDVADFFNHGGWQLPPSPSIIASTLVSASQRRTATIPCSSSVCVSSAQCPHNLSLCTSFSFCPHGPHHFSLTFLNMSTTVNRFPSPHLILFLTIATACI